MSAKQRHMRTFVYAALACSLLLFVYALFHLSNKSVVAVKQSVEQFSKHLKGSQLVGEEDKLKQQSHDDISAVQTDRMADDVPLDNSTSLHVHPSNDDESLSSIPPAFRDEEHHHDNARAAAELESKVRILCWVMTSPENHESHAIHVLKTWGKRCTKLLFVSEGGDSKLPVVEVKVKHGREHLTAKTMGAFDHIYEHHLNDADWFLKADDDTYVIVENLRYFLSSQDPDEPIYFGHHFHVIVKPQGYFSGGAGYVISREALKRFGRRQKGTCQADGGSEDVNMGYCMQALGVLAGDSRDSLNRSRFHCFDPRTHMEGRFPNWYLQWDKYGAKSGAETISDYAISFHYVSVKEMYFLEFFIYHLRPYGIDNGAQDLNRPRTPLPSPKPRSLADASNVPFGL